MVIYKHIQLDDLVGLLNPTVDARLPLITGVSPRSGATLDLLGEVATRTTKNNNINDSP